MIGGGDRGSWLKVVLLLHLKSFQMSVFVGVYKVKVDSGRRGGGGNGRKSLLKVNCGRHVCKCAIAV